MIDRRVVIRVSTVGDTILFDNFLKRRWKHTCLVPVRILTSTVKFVWKMSGKVPPWPHYLKQVVWEKQTNTKTIQFKKIILFCFTRLSTPTTHMYTLNCDEIGKIKRWEQQTAIKRPRTRSTHSVLIAQVSGSRRQMLFVGQSKPLNSHGKEGIAYPLSWK